MPLTNAHLPVILSPGVPSGTDPSSGYASGAQATAVFNDLDGIVYTFDTQTVGLNIYTMFDSMVTYLPPNSTYTPTLTGLTVTSEIATGAKGAVLMEISPLTDTELVSVIPNGLPVPVYIMIEGVEPTSLRTDLQTIIPTTPDPILDASWSETESSAPSTIARAVKEAKYLDRLFLSQKQLNVDGGDELGETELNTDGHPEFTIKLYFTEANFIANTYKISKVSALGFLRNFPSFIDIDPGNSAHISKWTGHPLLTSIEDFNEATIKAFIKFEMWNPGHTSPANEYVPVDAGLTVNMMEWDSGFNDLIQSEVTDANGLATFTVPVPSDGWLGGNPDIFFTILSPNASTATGLTGLPTEWSTIDPNSSVSSAVWKSVKGYDGYFPGFDGHLIGSPTKPLVFRVGVDFHVKFQHYKNDGTTAPSLEDVINGIPIELHKVLPTIPSDPTDDDPIVFDTPISTGTTSNGKGEFHGVVYDIKPRDTLFWKVIYSAEISALKLDSSVNEFEESLSVGGELTTNYLTTLRTDYDMQFNDNGNSNPDLASLRDFESILLNTIGTSAKPVIFHTYSTLNNQPRAALYTLKIAHELAVFYNNMTNGNYFGIKNTYRFATYANLGILVQIATGVRAHAVPLDTVQMTDLTDGWERATLIHESTHQVYWHAIDYSSLDIIGEVLVGGELALNHHGGYWYNNEQALIEGFPEAMELIFQGTYFPVYSFEKEETGFNTWGHSLGPSPTIPFNRGEEVEGIFANGMARIFWKLVVEPVLGYNPGKIIESTDGNLLTNNSWLGNTAIRTNYVNIIWDPLQNLINSSVDPNTTNYLANILSASANASIVHEIRGILCCFNMAVEIPTITGLSINTAPANTATTITVTGTNFIKDFRSNNMNRESEMLIVFVSTGSSPTSFTGSSLNVISDTQLEITTPMIPASTVNVEIELHINGPEAFSDDEDDSGTPGAYLRHKIQGTSTETFVFT